MSAMSEAAVGLEALLRERYRREVWALERDCERRVVVDFGLVEKEVRVQKFGWVVAPEDVRRCHFDDLAEELAKAIVSVERALVLGAGGSGRGGDALPDHGFLPRVVRCFLEGYEEPQAHAIVPPRVSWQGTDEQDGIKVRHIFGVFVPVPTASSPA